MLYPPAGLYANGSAIAAVAATSDKTKTPSRVVTLLICLSCTDETQPLQPNEPYVHVTTDWTEDKSENVECLKTGLGKSSLFTKHSRHSRLKGTLEPPGRAGLLREHDALEVCDGLFEALVSSDIGHFGRRLNNRVPWMATETNGNMFLSGFRLPG